MPKPTQVDPSVPRAKAVFHAVLPAIGFLVGGTYGSTIIALTGLAMAASVIGGPRYSVIGLIYRKLVQPAFKFASGTPEAAAPHRFAEAVGAAFLLTSGAFYIAGITSVGASLALIVVALATVQYVRIQAANAPSGGAVFTVRLPWGSASHSNGQIKD